MTKLAYLEIWVLVVGLVLLAIGIIIGSETVMAISGVFIAGAVVSASIGILGQ